MKTFTLLSLGILLSAPGVSQSRRIIKNIRDDSAQYASVVRPPHILFKLDEYRLDHPSNPMDSIKLIADFMKKHRTFVFEVAQHTDYRYNPQYSTHYSLKRAKSIVDSLIIHFGIEPDRITPAGYNESRPRYLEKAVTLPSGRVIPAGTVLTEKWIDKNVPKAKNANDYEHVMMLNRRTELIIVRRDYKPKVAFTLKGKVTHKLHKDPLPGATVKLVGTDNTALETKTDSAGEYFFGWTCFNPNTRYVINAKYFPAPEGLEGTHWGMGPTAKLTTVGLNESYEFRQDFELMPPLPPVQMPVLFFKRQSAKLKRNARDSLDKLVGIMKDNPNITVGISAYRDKSEPESIKAERVQRITDYLTKKSIDARRLSEDKDENPWIINHPMSAPEYLSVTFHILRLDYPKK